MRRTFGVGKVVMVSTETRQEVATFLKSRPSRLSYFVAEQGILRELAEAKAIPHAIVIDCDGSIAYERTGASDWSDPAVRAEIDRHIKACPS